MNINVVHSMKHVVLVGMMGAGKTTVGRYLAQCLARDLYDSDHEIEKREGRPISDIFASEGETYFRQVEREVIGALLDRDPSVISLGGGAWLQPEVRKLAKAEAVTFYLRASLQNLSRRVGDGSKRPLLEGKNIRAVLTERLNERDPIYRKADVTVSTDHRSSAQVGERIIEFRDRFD